MNLTLKVDYNSSYKISNSFICLINHDIDMFIHYLVDLLLFFSNPLLFDQMFLVFESILKTNR